MRSRLFLVTVLLITVTAAHSDAFAEVSELENGTSRTKPSALVIAFNYEHVALPLTVALWLLAASVAKIRRVSVLHSSTSFQCST